MYILKNLEEYKMMRKSISKTACFYTNICFFAKEIETHISRGKVYCTELENGFLMLIEEEKYYKLYVYGNIEQEFLIMPMNKRVVFRHTFRRDKGEDCPQVIVNSLKRNGFHEDGTLVYVHTDVDNMCNRTKNIESYVKKLQQNGYSFKTLSENYYYEVEELLLSTGKTRDYHLECTSENVTKICHAIVDGSGGLCAVCMGFTEAGGSTAAMMVKEEYKLKGLAPVLLYYRSKWLKEMDVQHCFGWIYTDNKDSLNFYKGLGFDVENKYIDEWVLGSQIEV